MTSSVQLCVTFPFGSLVVLSASFTRPPTQSEIDDGAAADANDMQPIDPDTVSAKIMNPDADVTAHAYLDSPGDIVRDDVGEFHLDVTGDMAGTWFFRFESTGTGRAANEGSFKIKPSEFP